MGAQLLLIVPGRIAERTFRAVNEFEALLDEGAALERGQEGGIRFQLRKIAGDLGGLGNTEIAKAFGGISERRKVPERGLLVEVGRLGGV